MNQEDIIRMAREAGFDKAYVSEEAALSLLVPIKRLFRAAYATGAAAERKKWEDQTQVEIHEAVLEEREACAKVCDGFTNGNHANLADLCADAIRARGEAK